MMRKTSVNVMAPIIKVNTTALRRMTSRDHAPDPVDQGFDGVGKSFERIHLARL